jgi:hypothetical protein
MCGTLTRATGRTIHKKTDDKQQDTVDCDQQKGMAIMAARCRCVQRSFFSVVVVAHSTTGAFLLSMRPSRGSRGRRPKLLDTDSNDGRWVDDDRMLSRRVSNH